MEGERVSGPMSGAGEWIGRGEAYVVVNCGYDDGADHEEPVGEGDVDLSVEDLGGVDHFDLGEVGELHDLREELEVLATRLSKKKTKSRTWKVDVIMA